MLLVGIWTVIVGISLGWNIWNENEVIKKLAENTARASFKKDLAFRLWISSHGGVYVPATDKTPPNPHLSHIPYRDIEKPDGTKLTLMNPAYMLHQMMTDHSGHYGIQGRITSLKYFNVRNKPDEWEKQALLDFEQGANEVFEYIEIEVKQYLRLMRPMITDNTCLKCHETQGYKVGDVRGGVGVSLPLQPLYEISSRNFNSLVIGHICIWLFGLGVIGVFSFREFGHISRRNEMMANLQISEEKFRSLSENNQDFIMRYDDQCRHLYMNDAGYRLLGFSKEEFIGKTHKELGFDLSLVDFWEKNIRKVFETGEAAGSFFSWEGPNGVIHLDWKVFPEFDNSGQVVTAIGVSRDITERINAEQEIKSSLKEKETLLSEIHHRVKNNMQIITSLLKLQMDQKDKKDVNSLLKENIGRVYALAAIHENLHQSDKLSEVDFKAYLEKLTHMLHQTYLVDPGKIEFQVICPEIALSIDHANPLGLVVNELVSNALKYAFPNNQQGTVSINACINHAGDFELTISDNGVGMPEGFDVDSTPTLGLRLVKDIVEQQLNGSISYHVDQGTTVVIKTNLLSSEN